MTEAQKRANAKYQAAHQKIVSFSFSRDSDRDILDALQAAPSRIDLVRNAIRAYLHDHPECRA